MRFPDNKMKALTFSYDDGVEQDRRLVKILNKYHLKGTFNLNSGIQNSTGIFQCNGLTIRRMNATGLRELYRGHEIAAHSFTHPDLSEQSIETIQKEIALDKKNLENIFGCQVQGMAFPYGTYDDRVIQVLKENNMKYARTVQETENFKLQSNLLEFKATCHHNNKNLMRLAEDFIKLDAVEPSIFYIWGHSYEFDVDNTWEMFEKFCARISNHSDIFYGSNAEVLLCNG